MGFNYSNYANLTLRGSRPSVDLLQLVSECFDVNPTWLLTGRGPMLNPQTGFLDKNGELVPQERQGFAIIPRISGEMSAGGGWEGEADTVLDVFAFREDWLRAHLQASPRDFFMANVHGESMEPTLRSGDLILVYTADSKMQYDAIYAFRMSGGLLVKRVQHVPGGTVVLRSDNSAYTAVELDPATMAEDFQVLGRVVWFGREI